MDDDTTIHSNDDHLPDNDDYSDDLYPDDNIGNRIEPEEQAQTRENVESSENAHPYEKLSPDLVIDAVESLGYRADARILALNSYENRVYQVGLEDTEPVVAKFYRPERWSDEQIQEEHAFSIFLNGLDIPVIPPIEHDGKTLFSFEGFRFSIYKKYGGRVPELDNLEHLKIMGQFIGRIHTASQGFKFLVRPVMTTKVWANDSVDYLLMHNFIPHELQESYEAITQAILKHLENNKPENYWQQIALHGDCHPGNVLWRNDKPHFVDFDDTITGPTIQDLWMLLSGSRNQQALQMETIIKGYRMFADFDTAQLQLIEPLRVMRVLHYNAWLAKRWCDPAFPISFPWFNTQRYWSEHILHLKELLSSLQEPALTLSL